MRSRTARVAVTPGGPLWSSRHLLVVAGMNAVGGMLIAIGWYQGSGQAHVDEMLGWLNVGIAGLIVIGAANALHVLRGRRTVGQLREVLLAQVPRLAPGPGRTPEISPEGDDATAVAVVAAEGMSHFHRPACPLAGGKTTSIGSVAEFTHAGLIACEVCEP